MMMDFNFWSRWNSQNKVLYLLLLFAFIVVSGISLYAAFNGLEAVIHWNISNQWERLSLLLDPLQVALFDFDIYADNYVVTETFSASPITINKDYAAYHLVFLGLGISLLLAVLSVLPRFWYVLGMAAFIFLVTNLKLEQLQLFGTTDFTSVIVVLLLYLPASYFLHAIRPDIRFSARCLFFLLITACTALIIYCFSQNANPWLYLANYGLVGPVILSILFIFIVAHEIIVAFLFVITNYNTKYSSHSVYHFSGLCLVYLLNVFFSYMRYRGALDWDIFYINAFVLLFISSILGIWGFRKRSSLFDNFIPMNGPGEILYLSLGIICFSTISYILLTGNDPLVETFEDAIIFSHFGFGLFFFIYVLANFFNLLLDNLKVIKVVYKPTRMPYYIANFGGLAVIILLLFRANLFPYYQAVAGYFNGIGDVYVAENNLYLAEQYYRLGRGYAYQNHRSNYSLGSLAYMQEDQATALFYFKESLGKHPSEYAYVNLANIYRENDRIFDAVFVLKEGMAKFESSGPIKNNLALLYNRLDMSDSALVILENAMEKAESKDAAQANALYIFVKESQELKPAANSPFLKDTDHIPAKANKLVIQNQNRIASPENLNLQFSSDSVLNMNSFSYVNNAVFNTYFKRDTDVAAIIDALQGKPENNAFHENLVFLRAIHTYYHNKISTAFRIMDNLQALGSESAGYYNYILGVWAMENQAYRLAAQFFEKSGQMGINESIVLKGVALSMAENPDRAREYWSSLVFEKDTGLVNTVSNMLRTINMDRDLTVPEEDEAFIYRSILFHHLQLSRSELNDLLNQIEARDLLASALIKTTNSYIKNEDLASARIYLEQLKEASQNQEGLSGKIPWIEAQILAASKDFRSLRSKAQDLNPIERDEEWHYIYFNALLAEHENDLNKADSLYRLLAVNNPFYERGIVDAVRFYQKQKNEIEIYNILLQAVEINSTSKILHQYFILQALEIGLTEYAESALEDFRNLVSYMEFDNFYKIYQAKLAEINQRNPDWD